MADNVPITAGSGTTIATDDIGGVHYQRNKLSLGDDGSAVDANSTDLDTGAGSDITLVTAIGVPASGGGVIIPGDVTNGLDVDVTRLPGTVATDITAIKTAVEILDNIVSGSEAQVDVLTLPALIASSAIIGKVQSANGFESTDNIYVASVVASAAGASKNHLSLYNADATLKVDVLEVYITKETTAAVTGLIRGHRLFRFTTAHSAGAVVAPLQLDTAMSALDADITARSASTIGGAEARPLGVIGIGEEETGSGGSKSSLFNHKDYNRPITLNTNEGVVIQQDATAGTGLISAVIVFRVR